MSIKTKALLQSIGAVVLIIGTSIGMNYLLAMLDPQAPTIVSIGMLLGIFFYMTYSLILSRLESKQILDKLNSNK
jgi:hypothetical protein